ncbi:MAG: DUF2341 domain-containing protein, partial [Fibrobacter sp.]|nr:DUF2341 domain-containing protein [Fibrobacter sp.]
TGADITEDILNFPILVRLTDSIFNFSQTLAGGEDIIFTNSNGKALPYEIELWDKENGNAVLWVRTDTIYGDDSTQHIIMYWGNESATRQTNSIAVFDTSDSIAGVWHLCNNSQDASTAGNNGTVCSAGDTTGIIGLCKKFNGNDSILIPGLLGSPETVTLSAWAKLDSSVALGGGEILSIGDAVLARMDYDDNGLGTGGAIHKSDTSNFNHLGSGRFLKHTGWHLVTFTFNGSTFTSTIFIDGIAAGSRNDPDIPISYSDVGLNTYIGKHANGKKKFGFFGCIDEVRVYSEVKSPDYIKLCYMNQRTDDRLVIFKK